MPQKLITPKFLTRAVAEASCTAVLRAVKENRDLFPLDGDTHHIVVLVPGMEDGRPDYPAWPDYQLHPVTLFEHSRGEKSKWNFPFDDIARCKAMQLWHDRNDDRTDCVPHLLFPGDTPYWGGVKRRGIVVTCSGYQPYFDKMISGMAADMMVARAHHAWLQSDDHANDRSFLK